MNIKRIIGICTTVALVVLVAITAKALVFTSYEKPVKNLIKGINKEDADLMLEAFALNTDDVGVDSKEISDQVEEVKEQVGNFVDDDEFKMTYDVMGKKKVGDEWLKNINTLYEASNIEIDKAYYLDLKLIMKKEDDDLEATIGVVVGKVDGDWKIVGGDALVMGVLTPSLIGYTANAKLDTANSGAKSVYNNASTYCASQEARGTPVSDGTYSYVAGVMSDSTVCASIQALMVSNTKDTVWVVKIENGMPCAALYSKDSSDRNVGSFPIEATKSSSGPLTASAVPDVNRGAEDIIGG